MISSKPLHANLSAVLTSAQSGPQAMEFKKILIKGLSGALGAGFSAVALYPLENVKIRQIVDKRKNPDEQKGMVETILAILKDEGLSGLFVGVVPYASYSIASWGIFFLFYESINQKFSLGHDKAWITSVLSGIASAILASPLSMVSNYIVSQRNNEQRSLGYFEAFLEVYQKSGITSFYNGLLFSLVLVVNPTINMQMFEKLKLVLPKLMQKDLALFLAGALSKLAATLATYPVQTVKTVMQAGLKGRGPIKEVLFLLREFGPFALFRGLQAKIAHSVLNSALMLFMTEKINRTVVAAVEKL